MVLSTHFDEYEKGESLRDNLQALLGTGVFNSDGPFRIPHLRRFNHYPTQENDGSRWKKQLVGTGSVNVSPRFHRSMTRPFFSKDRISDFELFDHHADQIITKMKERFKDGVAVDFQDASSRFTLDTVTVFLFGQDVKTLSGGLPYPSTCKESSPRTCPSDQFAFAFVQAQEQTFLRGFHRGFWPLFEFWEDTVAKHKNVVRQFVDPLIHAALEKKEAARGVCEVDRDDGTLLDYLVQQTDGTRSRCYCVAARQVLTLPRLRPHKR